MGTNITRIRAAVAYWLDRAAVRLSPAERVSAPYVVSVRRRGSSVELVNDGLVEALVLALLEEVAEDPEGVGAEAQYLLSAKGGERDRLLEQLVERLGGSENVLPAPTARRLAERLLTAAGPIPFPRQRGEQGRAA